MDDAFLTVHRDLPREGPGEAHDVDWAVAEGGLSGALRVIDAGCGPGADLAHLAEALPEATLEGVDMLAHFVAAAAERSARFGPRVRVRQGDMARLSGPVDLIWCAGALYFLGVTEGLAGWRPALAPGAQVVFSEPVLPERPPAPDTPEAASLSRFWADYPAITDMDGIVQRVQAAGFRVAAARRLAPSAWAAYYVPLSARVAALRPGADAALRTELDATGREIADWRAAPEAISYAQLLVRPA